MRINKNKMHEITTYYNNGEIIPRSKNCFYQGIENTLKAGCKYELDSEELQEYIKCHNDIIYFMEKYLGIKVREYQKEWIQNYIENKFNIFNIARMTGRVTIFAAIYLHEMIFKPNSKILIVAHKICDCVEIIQTMKVYYMKMQYFLKPNLITFNNSNIQFENGNSIHVAYKFTEVLGSNYKFVDLHEYAFYNDSGTILKSLVPIISSVLNSKLNIISTPNGFNHYHELVNNAKRKQNDPLKNSYNLIETYWWEVEGRDENWKQEEIDRIGIDKFDSYYDLQFKNIK